MIARLREDNINFPVVPKAETLKKWLDEAVSKRMAYTKGDFTGDGNDPFLQAFGSRFDPTELNVALDNYIAEGTSMLVALRARDHLKLRWNPDFEGTRLSRGAAEEHAFPGRVVDVCLRAERGRLDSEGAASPGPDAHHAGLGHFEQ